MINNRFIICIYGIVQGIGYRPFIYKTAVKYGIMGNVLNFGGAVRIDCCGSKENMKCFLTEIIKRPPDLARIEKVTCSRVQENKFAYGIKSNPNFFIKDSTVNKEQVSFLSPDIATCSKCREEILNISDRRYRYAFANCTECGPRYTIIKQLPYDRQSTTMQEFAMCDDCREEYESPGSRRFHAQPNCCEECGPTLSLLDNIGETVVCEDTIVEVVKLLKKGRIVAIKGIGGFHLVCDAKNSQVVKLLRKRKHREAKPFAIMAASLLIVKRICEVSNQEQAMLVSNKRPIVLLDKKDCALVSEEVAPGQKKLGMMLPYTPLHYMLFDNELDLIVMTSANNSGMPIIYQNETALSELSNIADYYLLHNREIHIPIDDSVVKAFYNSQMVVRRARGYIPFAMKIDTLREIMAMGAEQKSTVAVSKNGYVYLSQYLGDMEHLGGYNYMHLILEHYRKLLGVKEEIIVHDMHPGYISTKLAKTCNVKKIAIQHHHAHMVSCMAEHDINEPVIGIIFDGTGYGLDGAVWGGEFLVGGRSSFIRAGHLEYVTIQGGDQAVNEPWRCALSYLHSIGVNAPDYITGINKEDIQMVTQALDRRINCFQSSSMGRLFDAVAALAGVCNVISYDGQAAIELENRIDIAMNNEKNIRCAEKDRYLWDIEKRKEEYLISYKKIIEGILRDIERQESIATVAMRFHNTVAEASCALAVRLREVYRINRVVMSGGVFANHYLLTKLTRLLTQHGFSVFYNEQIPINDSGIAFGQMYAASEVLKEEGVNYVSCHTGSDYGN